MKKLLLASVLSVIWLFPALGQLESKIDTNTVVYSWTLDHTLANKIRVDVDTLLEQFQVYNPVFTLYTSPQTLGNYGQPAQSMVFTERPADDEFLLINNFHPYMMRYGNTQFINSRKPFSRLTYINGGSNNTKEEQLDAFHSQNLTKTLNFGIHFRTVGSLGQYQFQRVKSNSFNFFSSLSSRYYSYHVSVNYNKITADENGGILGDSLVTDSVFTRTKEIPTLFSGTESSLTHNPDVQHQIRNLNILAVQELALRSRPGRRDTLTNPRKIRVFYPKLVYIFTLNRTQRRFIDDNPTVGLDAGIYDNIFVSRRFTRDSLITWKIGNSARMQFQGRRNNHYYIDYGYDLMKYDMSVYAPSTNDSVVVLPPFISQPYQLRGFNYTSNIYNSYFSTGFTRMFGDRFDMNLFGKYYVSGYQSGDFSLSGDIRLALGNKEKPLIFTAKGLTELATPDYLYTRYAANNFIWTRNFRKVGTNHLSTNLAILSKKFAIQGDYYLLSDAIYLDNQAYPAQYGNVLSIIALSAYKQTDFWKVTTINKVVFQKSENENIIDLPELTWYNSTYLKHMFNFRRTDGKLLIMIGLNLLYNTKYYADAYMPSLSSFHRQNSKLLGNYPYLDVFLNAQLKRFRFFLKVEHANERWFESVFENNYFTVPNYPRNGRNLKFGLSWTFYD